MKNGRFSRYPIVDFYAKLDFISRNLIEYHYHYHHIDCMILRKTSIFLTEKIVDFTC